MRETHTMELSQCAACVCFNLRKTARLVTQLYDEALRPSGIRITQFTLLVALKMLEPVTMTELSEQVTMDRTTLARNLSPLEKAGLVSVTVGADRRSRIIKLTKKGHSTVAEALPLWKSVQQQVLNSLGEPRWKTTLANLAALERCTQTG
jgi:DNA-binding MarR family transcriptional regulator